MILDITPLRKYRDYRLLYTGQLVSLFGSMVTTVAVPVQVYNLTQSSFMVGLLGTVQLAPLLVFALLGGAYADSMDRRRLLVVSEILLALGSAVLMINALVSHPSVILIFVVSAAMSALNGFHRPALDALTPRLVERQDLRAVAALSSLRFSISSIVGPALGGVLIWKLGMASTYAIDVVSFVVSLVALASIRSMPEKEKVKASLGSIVEGMRYAISRPELVGTYLVDMIAMTFAMPMALFPAMAEKWGGPVAVGWLYAAMPIGALLATLLSGWTSKVDRHGVYVVIGAAIWGVAIIGLGFSHSLVAALIFLAIAGAGDNISVIFRSAIWNETIPTEFRGRLAGVEMISYLSGPMLGNTRAGWVASISSNGYSIVSGGFICLAGVLICIPLLPAFWKYRRVA
jgi:MFS family permease